MTQREELELANPGRFAPIFRRPDRQAFTTKRANDRKLALAYARLSYLGSRQSVQIQPLKVATSSG